MTRRNADAVLHRFLAECGRTEPSPNAVEPVLDRVWERLERRAEEFADRRVPAVPPRPFLFAWVTGIVLVTLFVNALVWRQGFPSSVASTAGNAKRESMSKSSVEQAGQTAQITAPQDVFEVASVKLVPSSSELIKTANQMKALQAYVTGCPGGQVGTSQLDAGRMTIAAITVFSLVVRAYGLDCTLVEGGPEWARSDNYYEIKALLPEGTPSYKLQDFDRGTAPRLQRMLQNLLADRFRLVVKRELREMPVYTLTVVNRNKMKLSPDQTPPDSSAPQPQMPFSPVLSSTMVAWGRIASLMSISGENQLSGHAVSMADLAKDLRRHAGRIVVDKTGESGLYDFDLKFAGDPPPNFFPAAPPQPTPPPQSIPPLPVPPPAPQALPGAPLSVAVEEQLGLKLESTRMPIEVLIIQSVERPSEN